VWANTEGRREKSNQKAGADLGALGMTRSSSRESNRGNGGSGLNLGEGRSVVVRSPAKKQWHFDQ